MASKEQKRADFEAVLPSIISDLKAHLKSYQVPDAALEWYDASLKHNTGGKLNRGLAVSDTASILLYPSPLTSQQYTDLATLGWLTELLQAFFLVSDDIMDASTTRRGKPCWYRMPGVNMIAINDAFMLESGIYTILKKRFKPHAAYVDFLELFHEVTLQTEVGQLLDLLTAPEDSVDLSKFSQQKQSFIMIYKTAYYSFYLPVALALHYCGLASENNLRQARDILIPTGEYFQVQDDFLDCYGDEATIGKKGTDIQDNKCGWLINQALPRASKEQRKVLDECYGRKDEGMEKRVKEIFAELELEKVYENYEEETVGRLRAMVERVDEGQGLKRGVFTEFVDKIYKRTK